VTDTGREVIFDPEAKPGVSNLLTILSALSGTAIPALEERFVGAGYGDLKKEVAEVFVSLVEPFQEKVNALMGNPATLDELLADGAGRARKIAAVRLADVYEKVGLLAGGR
jgi:tryptophanyl-tRNA synthetase